MNERKKTEMPVSSISTKNITRNYGKQPFVKLNAKIRLPPGGVRNYLPGDKKGVSPA